MSVLHADQYRTTAPYGGEEGGADRRQFHLGGQQGQGQNWRVPCSLQDEALILEAVKSRVKV